MNGSDSELAVGTSGSPQMSLMPRESLEVLRYNEALFSGRMPNASEANTPEEKFTRYSLDPSNPRSSGKPEAYRRGLGITKENASILIAQIHQAVTTENVLPYGIERSSHGVKFKYRIPVKGPNGRTRNVIAVYQIDKGSRTPRLITNYLEKRRKRDA